MFYNVDLFSFKLYFKLYFPFISLEFVRTYYGLSFFTYFSYIVYLF